MSALVLRGIFTLRRAELAWYYQWGASELFPEAWERFLAPIPKAERHDLIAAYRARLTHPDRDQQLRAARAWSTWEGETISLLPDPEIVAKHGNDEFALAFARIENHYFTHEGFFTEGQLINDAHRLRDIPGVIVQGRYDVACPARTAWDLHEAWPTARFIVVPDAVTRRASPASCIIWSKRPTGSPTSAAGGRAKTSRSHHEALGEVAMAIDRFKRPALVIVDMQNDFVRVGAPLEVPEARPTIPVHQALLAACRPRGIPVIYTKFLAGPERTLIWDWSPQVAPPVCCCWKGFLRFYEDVGKELDCADIIDEIYPEPGDPIVDKFGYGAFHNTNLDDLLKARHVESVLITGTVTQICVEETARESFKRGYPTTLISDAVSTYAPDLQAAVFKNFAHKFGWVSTAKEVIGALESGAIR